MTQNCEFLFGYTNLVVNGVIILIIIVNFVVHKFLQLQEAELTEQNNRLLLLSTQDFCYRFSLDQMQQATSNFHDELVIGKGGFGNVYKGTFKVGPTIVAIKRLHSRSSQGPLEFRTEIEMLSKFRHSHLVSLIGYCDDGYEMILVYEFMPGGTLADHLYKRVRQGHKSTPTLSWVQRLKVCIGAARGLDYLHTGTGIQHRIIHRDVKTTNILLDENLAAKISDFGLSKISPANQGTTYVSTHVKGTFAYLDPYYLSTHRLTSKSDVYSFGVVLFEVLCGRPAVDKTLDKEQMGLAGWAQHCFREGLLGHIIDPKIKDEASPDCLEAFVKIAIQCLQFGPKHRPNMAEVVVALESTLVLQEKINVYILPEIIISDDDQDGIDFSKLEVEMAESEKRMVVVSKGSHQGKQSSTKTTFTERFITYKGHMQNFLQAIGGRRLELSLRRRDVEQWMSHRRLPEELRRQIRESERYNWAVTRGVDETMLLKNLPEDLQRDIRRHLFKLVKKVRIFSLMDEPILDAMRERLKQKTYIKGSRILVPGGLIDKMVFIVRGKLESIGEDKNIVPLSEGDACGEELLTWCLEHSSATKGRRLLSSRTVRCVTNVETFILRAADLEEVASLFRRYLRNPRVQHALRYESPYWRAIAATKIQIAWRYRKKRLSGATTVSSASPRNY